VTITSTDNGTAAAIDQLVEGATKALAEYASVKNKQKYVSQK
jgi:hypothetical protein